MLRTVRFDEYFARIPIHHKSLLLWGTDDRLHKPWHDPVVADYHMTKDLLAGEGKWIVGGGHAMVVDSCLTVFEQVRAFTVLEAGVPSGANSSLTLSALCAALRLALRSTALPVQDMSTNGIDALTRIRCKL